MATVVEKLNAILTSNASISEGINHILQNQENSGSTAVLAAIEGVAKNEEIIKAALGNDEPAPAPVA